LSDLLFSEQEICNLVRPFLSSNVFLIWSRSSRIYFMCLFLSFDTVICLETESFAVLSSFTSLDFLALGYYPSILVLPLLPCNLQIHTWLCFCGFLLKLAMWPLSFSSLVASGVLCLWSKFGFRSFCLGYQSLLSVSAIFVAVFSAMLFCNLMSIGIIDTVYPFLFASLHLSIIIC
jgi:hypothetical protein